MLTTPIFQKVAVLVLFLLSVVTPGALQCQTDTLPAGFTQLLARTKLAFIRPKGMTPTPCVENEQMNYEYALKLPEHNFEVRYAIRPMDSLLVNFEDRVKAGETMIDPNKLSVSLLQATLLNIGLGGPASGELPDISYFDKDAVREEFGADWGAVAFVQPGPEFGGTTFKYCLTVIIHKDFVGDAYFFYVSDSKEYMSDWVDIAFHSLKFRE